jgi:signal transduction histidine kinase
VIETGQPGDIDLTLLDIGVGARHHHVQFVAERGAQGEIVGALAIGRDITERKEAELRLLATEHRLEESRVQLRQLASHLEAAREEERGRIARELHDELGQQLVGLRIGVNLLDFQFGQDEPGIREATAQLRLLVDRTIQITRNVSSSLRPAVLDMGIVAALEWLAAEFSQQTGIPCGLRVPEGDVLLCERQAITVFRIAQESLTNAARYAKAERIEIAFDREAEAHVLEIKDDGVGFDTTAPRKLKSFGLVGIRERALAVGGELIISSAPGAGTAVQVRIPIAEASVSEA